jgi:cephalosporin hydroxylase
MIVDNFDQKNRERIARMPEDARLQQLSRDWFNQASKHEYSYHFEWLGVPIIQFPQDIVAMQEIIWRVKPDLIVETGVARGGSIIFYASMLELIGGPGRVLGIDIDIREHNRKRIESHPMAKRIDLIQGSSIDPAIADRARQAAANYQRVLVVLDSNHTHDHVLAELELYSPLVKQGSYLVVFDTVVEHMPADFFPDRPWGHGNNPMTAVREFLKKNKRFEIDEETTSKLLISVAPSGFLRCVKD